MFGFQKIPPFSVQTIAVCGTEHGCGTTHFAFALSNYLCSKYRKRTAYVELNGSSQIRSLSDGTDECDTDMFFYMDIACYPSAIPEDLNRIFAGHFVYIIFDLGVLNSETGREFYRCDIKFIIGSVSPWKAELFYEKLESILYNTNGDQDHIVILGNLGIKENLRNFQLLCGHSVIAIPFLPNPFQLTVANCTFFQEMLAKNGIHIPR